MVRYSLDPENPRISCKERGSNLCVHFENTCETAQAFKTMHTREATKYLKDITLQKQWVLLVITMVELGSVQRPASRGWMQGRWPRKSSEFLLHVLKNAESNAELRGFDVDSLVIEHVQVKKPPRCSTECTELMDGSTPTWTLPAAWRWSLMKKNIVPKPEEDVAQKKKIS